MDLKLPKTDLLFRNDLLYTIDAKSINIDHTLINLFVLLQNNGQRPHRQRRGKFDKERMHKIIEGLETHGLLEGFTGNPEAIDLWLRTGLINLVNRGKLDKEKISSLVPIHLESAKVRTVHARDYFSAEQVYQMLSINPGVMASLRQYLGEGFDHRTNKVVNAEKLDVDTLGILHMASKLKDTSKSSVTAISKVTPLLRKEAETFCDDIRRLLVYKSVIPRNVMIDYLKTLVSFHLSLYLQKLIHVLPKMIDKGTVDVENNWSIVVDVTDNYDSKMSSLAIKDAELLVGKIQDYIRATFKVNAALDALDLERDDSKNLLSALDAIKEKSDDFLSDFKSDYRKLMKELKGADKEEVEEIKEHIEEYTQFDSDYFEKYVSILVLEKGSYQFRYNRDMIDNLSQKNNERGFMSAGRSKKHPRKFRLGTKLLETLIQVLVLEDETDHFTTRSLSIQELTAEIRERYGLIINGIDEDRFKDADLATNLAFKENTEALKNKLRQIGFFNDLSDAYILQKVRPRYDINTLQQQ